jgi:MFS family permease
MLADRAINRFGPPAIARASGIAATLGIIVATTAMGLPQALIGFAMMGAGYATLFPLAFSRAAADPDISPGRAIASVATLGYGGLLAGPPLIGFLAEATSLRLALASLAAFAILIVAFAPHLRVPRS